MRSFKCVLLSAASIFGLALAGPAAGQEYVDVTAGPDATEYIVPNNDVTPGPPLINPATGLPYPGSTSANSPDILDSGVNGVGQQIAFIQTGPTSAGLGLCTGTLINPRTVLTAAHCLHNNAAHLYGSNTGTGGGTFGVFGTTQGIPLSFGFNSTNRCINTNGCTAGQGAYEAWRAAGFNTVTALNIYNANQVWYRRSAQPVNLGGGGEFANGDIALVTLDTHAKDIPTWTLLFSPLDSPAHAIITGYGGTGSGATGTMPAAVAIDYRRRSAENMVDALLTANNFWNFVNGGGAPGFNHPVYWTDFDDPNRAETGADLNMACYFVFVNCTDFGPLGGHGPEGSALPREATTAGGDSGGPLIVDQRWDRQVIIGVLTGSYSYTGGRSFYGQMTVYPPLYEFWEDLVQNNPYKYASAKAGNGDWFDPTHWVQDMDPNYVIIGADGQLVNALPDTHQGGGDGAVAQFGTVCALTLDGSFSDADMQAAYGNCSDASTGTTPTGDGTSLIIAGGPGSTNFVPNNVEPVNSATAGATIQARYYDVTLREAGTTTLSAAAQIDKLTIDGLAKLNIASSGNLGVWAEFNQISGWTNVDGQLKTDEALIVSGLLTGNGLFDPTFLTVVGGIVAPGGGDSIGTLTVQGDVILASASSLFIDVQRGSADKLVVIGDSANTGILALNGGAIVFNKVTNGPAPRHGDSIVFATATGGVDGTFGGAYTFQGVLRPEITYGANSITALLRAGSLVEIIDGGSATELAFASALDALRGASYTDLWNLYGSIDWMNSSQLSATFAALTPRVLGDVGALHDRQSKLLLTNVSDRLSLLASGRANGLAMTGNLTAALAARSDGVQSGTLNFGAGNGGDVSVAKLPGRLTGFVSGGIDRTASSYGGKQLYASQGSWHMAMGLEMPFGDKGTLGTAVGLAEGESSPAGDRNRSRTTMAAAYAAMPLGDGFYVGGMASAESSRASIDRLSTDGSALLKLSGATNATRYSAIVEAGYEKGIGFGLTLTPRAQLGYSYYSLGGFTEQGGETALKLDSLSVSRVEARLGAKLEGKTRIAGVSITPQLSADYISLLSGREMGANVRFASAPGEVFYLPLATSDRGWAEVKGGVTFGDGPVSLGLSGQHSTSDAMTDNRAQAELRIRF